MQGIWWPLSVISFAESSSKHDERYFKKKKRRREITDAESMLQHDRSRRMGDV